MSACVYQWGEMIGLQWNDRGPIIFFDGNGETGRRFSVPADATVLLHTGDADPSLDEPYDSKSYDDGYKDGYRDATDSIRRELGSLD